MAVVAMAAIPGASLAQDDFPDRTIDIMVHAGAGGGTDLTANAAISGLRETVGWDAAINRKTGAGGAVSHQYVMQQPCDGYNVITLTSSQISTIAQGKSPFGIDDLVGIGRATVDPIYLMTAADGPYPTAEEFLAAAKEEPLSIGLVTIGGGDHITVFLMAERGDLMQPQAVPSDSGGTAAVSVVAGDLDAGMVGVSEAGAMIDAGDIRPIIAFTEERQEDFPDVPTAKELGMDLVRPTLRGFAVRDCTPEDRVATLRDGFAQAMATEGYQTYLRNAGIPLDSVASGEVFEEAIQREHDEAVEALTALGLM
ncbi:Bug family tripartite tricarboxylate transporter substrate binding protein [Roseitranquillus sediminis]|uniref:Bug family tripartite tricarboxylate transporter substrate binding protein n=1 Tax=Roseitranquillus sediminis TaxID=2809051 RepID=UPI001D0C6EBE|nr:tripartite tricarboxylate transporter substrate binding protein [Roseitranquillus sediminis]MBM9595478.1 tripartite tricarboxylate transporter substrate binding protein [Roseitranquillus sediminis]